MFEIRLESPAKRFLKKIDTQEKIKIIKKLKELKSNPKLGKPLIGKLAGLRSLRIGKYRAIYQIKQDRLLIFVLRMGHRKSIYD